MLDFPIVLLHLSDLHFGWDLKRRDTDNREIALSGLLSVLRSLPNEWQPQAIAITGDIGWKGRQGDYNLARDWLGKLLTEVKLDGSRVFPCPGNHDIVRHAAQKVPRPSSFEEADSALSVEAGPNGIASHFEDHFAQYSQFCRDLQIPAYSLGETDSYCVGTRSLGDLAFVCCNTAWFSRDDYDSGKLWLGQPFLKHLEMDKALVAPIELNADSRIFVALAHHPPECLASAELNAFGQRPNTRDYLVKGATYC